MPISRRAFLQTCAAAGTFGCAGSAPDSRPNIVLILADDLGWGDIGCFGSSDIHTPHLDRLASQGMRLTNHYVCSPVCSPSRSGLLTGLYPPRTGIEGVLRDHHDSIGLDLSAVTLADVLAEAGYETGLVGKWHLGVSEPYWPRRRGFQYFYGFLSGTIDYWTHLSNGGGLTGRPVTYRNEEPVADGGYFPQRVRDEAVRFIERPRDKPFFLYLPLGLPHKPLQAPEERIAPYRDHPDPERAVYAAMVSFLDATVGAVSAALERADLSRNTLLVFLSDHGWVKHNREAHIGDNGPFRGGKYELSEGGVRSPAIVRRPGLVPAGSESAELCWSLDWAPTLAAAAGTAMPADGSDILGVLRGRPAPERTLYWRFADNPTPFSLAARRAQWKYLRVGDQASLYDLDADPGESTDRAGEEPDRFAELEAAAEAWNREMGEWSWRYSPER